jgi:hypothetical protein
VGAPAGDGLPPRDVDHDLIAAGHPRLNFEFAAYLANMPPHWVERERNAEKDFPARAWMIGQVVSAEAAIKLLQDRAERASRSRERWPEFSEYGCFSCHHELRDAAWRRERPRDQNPLGIPEWGSWYFALTPKLATADAASRRDAVVPALDALRAAMARADPDPKTVAAGAADANRVLAGWLKVLPGETLDAARIRRLSDTIQAETGSADAHSSVSWDRAAQAYLALVPLRQALQRLEPIQIDQNNDDALKALLKRLEFPAGYDSPRGYDPGILRESAKPPGSGGEESHRRRSH